MEVADAHSYLGMQLILKEGSVQVNMQYFIEKLLLSCGEEELQESATPAGKDLFMVDRKSPVLAEKMRRLFHTNVAKLLYLTKRARPDILTATGFLCTRVTKATVQDRKKLRRVLGYLKRTQGWIMTLTPEDLKKLEAYIDAAFASHPDAKSHSGIALLLGKALVYAASRKQKCVTKSPTDSELVGLTDHIGFVELFGEFLTFITNTKFVPPVIYQDCTAVIALVTECGGVARTKHLRVRMELCREGLQQNRFQILYTMTHKMIADGLTKPLEGQPFLTFASNMLGIIAE